MRRVLALLGLLVVLTAFPGTRISLVTFYPGPGIYELDGHTALRLIDDTTGRDMMYNWGTFDFYAPNFVYRFVKGETDYCVDNVPSELYLEYYRRQGRRVVEQALDFTPGQADRLKALVEENMRPENRVYRYNYVLDNCATRPLAMLEEAVGDTLVLGKAPRAHTDTTFRAVMTTYHRNYPWYQFGIDMALGSGIDRKVSNRERSFEPVDLQHMIASAYVADNVTGHLRPIVTETRVLVEGKPGGAVLAPTPWWGTPLAMCWVFCAVAVLLTRRDWRRGRVSRWFDALMYAAYGMAGLLLTFLIFVSVHEATSPNWLYLWLNPLCFAGVAGACIKSGSRVVYWWQILNFALLLALCVLAVAGVQGLNPAFWPLILADLARSINYIHIFRKCNLSKTSR